MIIQTHGIRVCNSHANAMTSIQTSKRSLICLWSRPQRRTKERAAAILREAPTVRPLVHTRGLNYHSIISTSSTAHGTRVIRRHS
jgi:hypothetical protein